MYFRRQKNIAQGKENIEERNKKGLEKTQIKDGVLQFGSRRKVRGGAFLFGALVLIALKAIKSIIKEMERKLK